jgi:quercetin dioxygenase-like cupin family protein
MKNILLWASFGVFALNAQTVQHINIKKAPTQKFSERISRKLFMGEHGDMAVYTLKKGAFIPEHQHPQEQFSYIQSGKVKVIIHGQEHIISGGEVIVIPGNLPHSFEALEDTVDIDFFSPHRDEDWRNGSASFLQSSK